MKKKVVLYIRVSTEEQKISGNSLEFQKNKLINYCKDKGISNYELYDDGGYSASTKNRPCYKKIISEINKGSIEKVIFLKLDRITRNSFDFLNFYNLCEKENVEIVSLEEHIDRTPMGKFFLLFYVNQAELERNQISVRTKNGIIGGLEKGEFPFGGKLPLGISRDKNKKLYYNPDIKKVKFIFEESSKGLTRREIRIKYENKYQTKIGKTFIEDILNNAIYKGYKIYNNKKYILIKKLNFYDFKNQYRGEHNKGLKKHYNYAFANLLKDYNVITKNKFLKKTKKIKEYKYYKHKHFNHLISEEKLGEIIDKKIKVTKKSLMAKYKLQLKKLKYLFVTTKMSKHEYEDLEERIQNNLKKNTKISFIKEMKIYADKKIKIILNNNKKIKFNYDYELKLIK